VTVALVAACGQQGCFFSPPLAGDATTVSPRLSLGQVADAASSPAVVLQNVPLSWVVSGRSLPYQGWKNLSP